MRDNGRSGIDAEDIKASGAEGCCSGQASNAAAGDENVMIHQVPPFIHWVSGIVRGARVHGQIAATCLYQRAEKAGEVIGVVLDIGARLGVRGHVDRAQAHGMWDFEVARVVLEHGGGFGG